MKKDEVLFSNLNDKFLRAANDGYITNSDFLDEYEQSQTITHFSKLTDCKLFIYGKKDDFDRGMAVFVPSFLGISNAFQLKDYFKKNGGDPIDCLFVKKDRFSTLTHRDYLGAIMGLGIERKMIGDIVVVSNGAYIFVSEKISKYVLGNLKSVGRGSVEVIISDDYLQNAVVNIESINVTVPSMRLDSIVSAVFKISRSKAAEAILNGFVFQNGLQTEKPDAKVVQGDKIVFRKKGKSVVNSVVGKSKKDRFILQIDVYK